VDGTTRIIESTAIMEWLEEVKPEPPLLPKTPDDRARVRALVQVINSGIQPLQNLVVLDKLAEPEGAGKERRLEWLRFFISKGLGAFEQLADEKGPFAAGATFSMADCTLLPQLYAARRYGVDLASCPRVLRAEDAAKDLPFVKAAYPDGQPDARP
jgi:maleylpyruvate isomerase